jgi:dihydrofolate reductase
MSFNIILATDKDYGIAKDHKIPWYFSEDLKHFKKITVNKTVIMGRKTFESIGKPLPNRENVVITSKANNNELKNGFRFFTSIDQFFSYERRIIRDHSVDYWFIGGE